MTRLSRSLLPAVLGAASLGSAAAAPAPMAAIPLPPDVAYPEGVGYDPSNGTFYAGSAVDGIVVRIDGRTGKATTLVPPGRTVPPGSHFAAMLGMHVDRMHRLWIAGGSTGLLSVVDTRTGRMLRQSKVPTTPKTELNDLVFAGGYAYVTDTFFPMLWRAAMSGPHMGEIEPFIDMSGTPMAYVAGEGAAGANGNGITATPDGRTLIMIQMNQGRLFRVDVATKKLTPIDTGASALKGTDGLLLVGRTLYATRQWDGEVVRLALDAALTRATETARYKSDQFSYPATFAKVGDTLVIANTQFNHFKANDPKRPFELLKLPLAQLGAAR